MNRTDLEERTADFARRVVRLYYKLKQCDEVARHFGMQLIRSGTSIGANYAEAIHGRSGAEFVSKLKICEGEAAESAYWIERIMDENFVEPQKLSDLHSEAKQLIAIFCASAKTHKKNNE